MPTPRAKKADPFLSARVRAIAETIHQGGLHERLPKRSLTLVRIPLAQIGEEGINLNLSDTGCHMIIKM